MAFNSVDSELQAAQEEEEARREQEELERMYTLDEERQQARQRLNNTTEGARSYAKDAAKKAVKSAAGKVAKRGATQAVIATAPYWGPVLLIILGLILLISIVVMVPVIVCNSNGVGGTVSRWTSTIASKMGLTTDICGSLTFGGGASGGAGASGSFEPGTGQRAGKYTDAEAREQLILANVCNYPVGASRSDCVNAPRPQTSLENVNIASIDEVMRFKQGCDAWAGNRGPCDVVVTGGTEGGHAVGACSHANGYKIDIRVNTLVNSYVRQFAQTVDRDDRRGPVNQFVSDSGGIYAGEGDHWDILIGCGSVLNET